MSKIVLKYIELAYDADEVRFVDRRGRLFSMSSRFVKQFLHKMEIGDCLVWTGTKFHCYGHSHLGVEMWVMADCEFVRRL